MPTTRSLVGSATVTLLLFLLPGCRSNSPEAPGTVSTGALTPSIDSKKDLKSSANRIEAQARFATGLSFDLKREPEKAIEQYILSLKADPSNEELVVDVSRRLVMARQLKRALEVVELAATAPNPSAMIYGQLGVLYAELDRPKDAEAANRKAIALAPDELVSYYNLYMLFLKDGEQEKALEVLETAAARKNSNPVFWLDLAELFANYIRNVPSSRESVAPKTRACLERAETIGVADPQQTRKLADGYASTGDNPRAVKLYLALLEDDDADPRLQTAVRQKLLSIYISDNDTAGALKQLEVLVREYPLNPQANYLLASVSFERGDFPRAVEYFRKTIDLDPEFEQAYYSLTGAYLNTGDNEAAVALMEKARQKFPKNFVSEYYSGITYGRVENHARAVAYFTSAEIIARATNPERLDHGFYFQLGAQQERNGQFDEAVQSFKKCLGMKSDFAPAMNYLGYMWADKGIELEEARKLIQKAVDAEPKNPAYLDSLAWVLFKLDQPNLALVYAEEALDLQAEEGEPDPTLYDHLGDIHHALQQPAAARDAWKKSLGLKPDEAIQEKLDQLLLENPELRE